MGRRVMLVVLGVFGALVISLFAVLLTLALRPGGSDEVLVSGRSPDPSRPDPAVAGAGLKILPFSLIDQDGREVDETVLDGRVTIVDFVFTHCPFACPILSSGMEEMQGALRGTGVRFMSFSLDPERDTPERLREYGAGYNADFSRWSFLTGDQGQVFRMVREGLLMEVGPDESTPIELPDGTTMQNIVHPSWFILVGPRREVLGLYRSTDAQDVRELVIRARSVDRLMRDRR